MTSEPAASAFRVLGGAAEGLGKDHTGVEGTSSHRWKRGEGKNMGGDMGKDCFAVCGGRGREKGGRTKVGKIASSEKEGAGILTLAGPVCSPAACVAAAKCSSWG